MINKTSLRKRFIFGAVGIFHFSALALWQLGKRSNKRSNKSSDYHDGAQYLLHVCDDLNKAYNKLKKQYERK